MIIEFHKNFKKALKKQPNEIQYKFKQRLKIFSENQFHYLLNNNALSGKFKGWRSFNVTGDIRVYYEEHGDIIILMGIGTQPQFY